VFETGTLYVVSREPPASASKVLGLQDCTPMPGSVFILLVVVKKDT
jgi:hypothetical protein